MNPSAIPVKIYCACGQKYSFEVWPREGRMPAPISCPVCQRDGTAEADRVIARVLHGKTQPLPPPSINTLLNHVQASLAPHLVDALKDAVVDAATATATAYRCNMTLTTMRRALHDLNHAVVAWQGATGRAIEQYRIVNLPQ